MSPDIPRSRYGATCSREDEAAERIIADLRRYDWDVLSADRTMGLFGVEGDAEVSRRSLRGDRRTAAEHLGEANEHGYRR